MLDQLEKWWERTFVRLAAYMAFAALSFLIFLLWTFPDQRVAQIAEQEIAAAFGHEYEVSVGSVRLWRMSGMKAKNIRLQERRVDDDEDAMPTTLLLDGVSARFSPMRSVMGRALSGRYKIDIGGDSIDGTVNFRGNDLEVSAKFDEVDLRNSTLLASLLGFPLFGVLDGDLEVIFDMGQGGALTGGGVDLRGEQLTLGSTQIQHDSFPLTIDLPTTSFGALVFQADIEGTEQGARINFERFATEGGRDIHLELWGHLELGSRGTRPELDMRLQVSDQYVNEHDLSPVFNVQQFRDGSYQNWYGFVIRGGRGGDVDFHGSRTAAQGPQAGTAEPTPAQQEEAPPQQGAPDRPERGVERQEAEEGPTPRPERRRGAE